MDRIQLISLVNPEWAVIINTFIEEYPEFRQYAYLAPLNEIEPIHYNNVNTLFEAIMHYICAVGVRYSYAIQQWELIYPFINCKNWETIMENSINLRYNVDIQPKKREIYYNFIQFLNENNLNHTNLNPSHLKFIQKNVSGIGVGCIAWCKKYFTMDDDCIRKTLIG